MHSQSGRSGSPGHQQHTQSSKRFHIHIAWKNSVNLQLTWLFHHHLCFDDVKEKKITWKKVTRTNTGKNCIRSCKLHLNIVSWNTCWGFKKHKSMQWIFTCKFLYTLKKYTFATFWFQFVLLYYSKTHSHWGRTDRKQTYLYTIIAFMKSTCW